MQAIFDSQWRARALAGDPDAAQRLAREALEPLYAFCLYRVGRDRDLCEEVVQETLLRALGQLERYDPERASHRIFPWLTGLARNEIQRVLNRATAAQSLELLWQRMDVDLLRIYQSLDDEPVSDELLARDETRELVNVTMSQLSPRQRASLVEKYVHGRSVRDIAGLMSLSEKAVESLLTRARSAFRATFLALARNLNAGLS